MVIDINMQTIYWTSVSLLYWTQFSFFSYFMEHTIWTKEKLCSFLFYIFNKTDCKLVSDRMDRSLCSCLFLISSLVKFTQPLILSTWSMFQPSQCSYEAHTVNYFTVWSQHISQIDTARQNTFVCTSLRVN